jgi:hypothetical protein
VKRWLVAAATLAFRDPEKAVDTHSVLGVLPSGTDPLQIEAALGSSAWFVPFRKKWCLTPIGEKAFLKAYREDWIMASKKKKAEAPNWKRLVVEKFLAQVDEGKSPVGFTFAEMREALGVSGSDDGYKEAALAMTDLRVAGILSNRFTSGVEFNDSDTDGIPNLVKRVGNNVRQIVYFVSAHAMRYLETLADIAAAVPDNPTEYALPALDAAEIENMPAGLNRKGIADFFDNLAEVIDLYAEPEKVAYYAKYIQALKPETT